MDQAKEEVEDVRRDAVEDAVSIAKAIAVVVTMYGSDTEPLVQGLAMAHRDACYYITALLDAEHSIDRERRELLTLAEAEKEKSTDG